MTPCQVSAFGLVSCLGQGQEEHWKALQGPAPTPLEPFALPEGSQCLVGRVHSPLPPLEAWPLCWQSRNNQLAQVCLDQIQPQVQAALEQWGANRVGVFLGTSTSGMESTEKAYLAQAAGKPLSFDYAAHEVGSLAEFVAEQTGAKGPCASLSTACSSSAHSFGSAWQLMQAGLIDAALVGGIDSLCTLTVHGFASLGLVSQGRSNPMGLGRDGLNIGEGGAIFLLERKSGGLQLLGVGSSGDAHHMSSPHPEGRGAEEAMRMALRQAGLAVEEITTLNLHGTGTPQNDQAEALAVQRVFGENLPLSSTKSLTGHCLGSAASIEAAFVCLQLQAMTSTHLPLLPHLLQGPVDPELPPLYLVQPGEKAPHHGQARVMSNSFAFGGNNASLILGRRWDA